MSDSEIPKKYSLGVELPVLRTCDHTAAVFFNWLKQTPSEHETTVKYASEATHQDYYDVLELFKALDSLQVGEFILGRKGHESRLKWKYSTQSICDLAFEEKFDESDLEPIEPKLLFTSTSNDKVKYFDHEFMLRPDTLLKISLPDNFNRNDYIRLTKWLDTIPFD